MRKVFTFFSLIIILAFAVQASAQISSKGDGNWNSPSTWVGNNVPASTDNVVIDHVVTVVSGQSAVIASVTNNNTIVINGTITINGSYSESTSGRISSTSGSLIIGGIGTFGAITFSPTASTLTNLTINRTTSGTVTLNSNLTVSGTLTLTNGNIITGTNTLTLGTSATSVGSLVFPTLPSNSSYIVGNFERWISATTGTYNLPIGTTNYYRPVTLIYTSAPTTGGRILFSGFDSDPGTKNTSNLSDAGYMLDRFSNEAWWRATNTGISGGTYSINLGAYTINGVSASNFSKIRVIKRIDSNNLWILEGTHVDADGAVGFRTAKRSGLTSFSEFGIGGLSTDGNTFNNSPLPVTLKSFTSLISGRDVKLNWITEKEVNNKGFDVERVKSSESGFKGYEKIGFVESKGNVNTATSYSFNDKNLTSGRYKYRLKQIDYNGNYEYFELNGEVTVGVPKKFDLSQNYPNPFNPVTKINFDLPEDGKVNLVIYDMLGREAATLVNDVRTAGYYTVSFDASRLSSGMYFYRLSAGNYSAVKKMAVIK